MNSEDFKYAALNAALDRGANKENRCVLGAVWDGCLAGGVPVVDLTSVVDLWRRNKDSFWGTVMSFRRHGEVRDGKVPIAALVAYSRIQETFVCPTPGGLPVSNNGFVVACKYMGEAWRIQMYVVADIAGYGIATADPEEGDDIFSLIGPSLDAAFAWMSMRNADWEDSAAPRAFRRRYSAIGSVKFRRVFISPVKRGHATPRYEITGENCPLHHVRGHIRHVSESKPLFGRKGVHGMFWISEHWRGDEENGRVIQEYVPTPEEKAA